MTSTTTTTSSHENKNTNFQFTTDPNATNRVERIYLELVDFTVRVQLRDGSEHPISDSTAVQQILDGASSFNKSIGSDVRNGEGDDETEEGDRCKVVVEVELDPLNPIRSFHIPA